MNKFIKYKMLRRFSFKIFPHLFVLFKNTVYLKSLCTLEFIYFPISPKYM